MIKKGNEISISVSKVNLYLFQGLCVITVVSLLPLHYLFYGAVRLAFFAALVWTFIQLKRSPILSDWRLAVAGILAMLYNPIFPVILGEKVFWLAINIGTVVFLFLSREEVEYVAPVETETEQTE